MATVRLQQFERTSVLPTPGKTRYAGYEVSINESLNHHLPTLKLTQMETDRWQLAAAHECPSRNLEIHQWFNRVPSVGSVSHKTTIQLNL